MPQIIELGSGSKPIRRIIVLLLWRSLLAGRPINDRVSHEICPPGQDDRTLVVAAARGYPCARSPWCYAAFSIVSEILLHDHSC